MSTKWTYSGDPSSSSRDAVRFKIGDTTPTDMLFTDAEVEYAVSTEGSVNEASLCLARAGLAKFVRAYEAYDRDGDKILSKKLQQRIDNFKSLIEQLSLARGKRVTGIYAGGLTNSDKRTQEEDTNRVAPNFTRDMHNNPIASSPTPLDDEQP